MKVILLRHGKTAGNEQKRYIGITDEPLSGLGKEELYQKLGRGIYPPVHELYVSPMLRCRETADILYPGFPVILQPKFRECNFGEFENKNYKELDGNKKYQEWVDSNAKLPFPGGEGQEAFQLRCREGFLETMSGRKSECIGILAHGGTIMSILEQYALPKRSFYEWAVENGCGFLCEYDAAACRMTVLEEIC